PVRERHQELCADPGYVEGVLREGAEKARARSARRRSSSRQRASSASPRVNACNWTPPQTSSPVTWPSTVAPMPSGTATN
ncbi:tryptophan--tRNA ligase, partial [Streptomyces tendae]